MAKNDDLPISVRAAASVLQLDELTRRTIVGLRQAGIYCIVLKGPSISRWLYTGGSRRHYVDSDLLVSPGDVDNARLVLEELGFEHPRGPLAPDLPGDRATYAYGWIDRATGARLELHQTLIGIGAEPEEAWRVLSQHTEEMVLLGEPIDVLDAPARTMHVALHAAQDGGRASRAMRDLSRAIGKVPPYVWSQAKSLADELDALPAFSYALRLHPEGRELARALRLPAQDTVDVILHAEWSPSSARGFEWLASQPGLLPKVKLVTHKLFPPADFMRAWMPLARRGRWGLLLAYVWRPLWIIWQAIPGLVTWLKARQKAARKR